MTLRLLNVRGRKSPREEDDSRAAGHEQNPELFKSTPALPPHKYKHFPDRLYTLSCCFFSRPSHSCYSALCLIYSFALPAIEHPLCLLCRPASSTFHSASHSNLFLCASHILSNSAVHYIGIPVSRVSGLCVRRERLGERL